MYQKVRELKNGETGRERGLSEAEVEALEKAVLAQVRQMLASIDVVDIDVEVDVTFFSPVS